MNGVRVLVLWADRRSANYGVRVLADGTAALAKRAFGGDTIVDFQDYGPGDSFVSFGARAIAKDVLSRRGPIRTKLRDYDLVIDTGAGDSFADIYGLKRFVTMIYAQWSAYKLGIPVVMGPQTIGPFDTVVGRSLARATLRRMSAILTRDSASQQFAEELGSPPPVRATDVVFALPRPTSSKQRDVVLNVSGLLWFGSSHVDKESYRSSVIALIDKLAASGRNVTLLAHVINPISVVDDRAAILEIMRARTPEIEVVFPESLGEAREVLAGATVVIGSRMHACLNAISSGTPAISWAYSRKFKALFNDLGWGHVFDLREETDIVGATLAELENVRKVGCAAEISRLLEEAEQRLELAVVEFRRSLS